MGIGDYWIGVWHSPSMARITDELSCILKIVERNLSVWGYA